MEQGDWFYNENRENCVKKWINKYLVYDKNLDEPLRLECCNPNTLFDFDWEHYEYIESILKDDEDDEI